MSLGIDLGNRATKTSKYKRFYSSVLPGHNDANTDDIKVVYKNQKYTVGSKTGVGFIGNNRYNSSMYDVCLLTAIGLSVAGDVVEDNIVVSLPPEVYESDLKKELRERLNNLGTQIIEINGERKLITITKAEVFCESAIVWTDPAKYKQQNTIVIDVGGSTTDISQYQGLKMVEYSTETLGLLSLYADMKKEMNKRHKARFTITDMEDIIGKTSYEIKGKMENLDYLRPVIQNHVRKICNVITQKFSIDNCRIELIGGGAEYLQEYFKKEYDFLTVPEQAQFKNAIVNAAIGDITHGRK